jgi:hypothetical protein
MKDARLWVKNLEPCLDEVLADPIVRQLMRRDGVTDAAFRNVIRAAAARLRPKLRLTMPLPDLGRKGPPRASRGVLAQTAAPAWPRVLPGL